MSHKTLVATSLSLFLAACAPEPGADNIESDAGSEEDTTGEEDEGSSETADGEAVDTEALSPMLGNYESVAVDCVGAYELPEVFLGPDGLGHHDWTLDDLTFTGSWPLGTDFSNNWISDDTNEGPSLRVRPWHVPDAGACFRSAMQEAIGGSSEAVLRASSAFAHREPSFDELAQDRYSSPDYDLSADTVLVKALRGLVELDNPLPGSLEAEAWTDELERELLESTAAYPHPLQQAIAKLLLAIGESHAAKLDALAAHPHADWQRIYEQFLFESYASVQNTFVSPTGGSMVTDMKAMAADFELHAVNAAAQGIAAAADEVRAAAESSGPFDAPDIVVSTAVGKVSLRSTQSDDDYGTADLAATALVVDLGGDDTYEGQYASTAASFGMAAGVLIDLAGNDIYGPNTPDIEASDTPPADAFGVQHGFTQGSGLFGVGLLLDAAGDDTYAASVYSQASGAFGIGILDDRGGADDYQLGYFGQGAGYFGSGLLIERRGDDRYGTYTMGQGLGKPAGLGLLLDGEGADVYIGYYEADEPYLPGPGYPNYYGLPSSWAYGRDGVPHFMSLVQGVGWGYRGDWGLGNSWMGGFGSLVDLGDGDDAHYADTFSMGQGFIYGFGFLYDDGGDDTYHSFWWGPAAGAHMGVALLWDEAGNDQTFVTRASGGFGFDWSVAWLIDHGGNDSYGGQMHLGEGYTWGQGYFINVGGDDAYNIPNELTNLGASAKMGFVRKGRPQTDLIGAFLDLGGGQDTYHTDLGEIADDLDWYLEPAGDDTNPEFHKGIGIDR